ncbi:hypothetical protein NDU88_002768 [Pleurodeles waltl]|uniref:Uncharacterized protein n=1 Tax=Pleurodeles waltl TaxID=8319 RepID=A0AAV7WPJ0_PLEWA|nr:hypothetical protein NDU88_002768 [Pleurodeles waltl]
MTPHGRVCVKKGLRCVYFTHKRDLALFLLSSGWAHCFFSLQESDASIRSALSGPGRPCVVFTHPELLALEIQPHDDPKTTQHRLRSQQPPSAMLHVISPAPCVDSSVVLEASVDFQLQSRQCVDFSAPDRSCVDLFPARRSVLVFLPLRLPASPFRVPGTR